MPIRKKAPAKKAAPKKAAPLGPKAKLMKLQVTTLRNKAKKLGVSDVTKRTKENLVQSIILGEARKKRGTAAGKKATAKKRTMAGVAPSRARAAAKASYQTGRSDSARDSARPAMPPGKRKSPSGGFYYERRKNRSDKPGSILGYDLQPLNTFVA